MDGIETIIAAVFVGLVLVGGAIAVQYADKTAADKYAANETVSSGPVGALVALENSSIEGAYYSDTAVVTNTSSGNTLVGNGTDYTWYDNGTLLIESQAAADTSLTVEYEYWTRSETQQDTTNIIGQIYSSGAWIPLLLIIALVVIGIGVFGRLS